MMKIKSNTLNPYSCSCLYKSLVSLSMTLYLFSSASLGPIFLCIGILIKNLDAMLQSQKETYLTMKSLRLDHVPFKTVPS